MKRKSQIVSTMIALMLIVIGSNVLAQKGMYQESREKGMSKDHTRCSAWIPDLTEEQEAQIKDLSVDHLDKMMDYRNQLNEKRASLRTLETADNPDMDKINSVIEEMGEMKTDSHKERAAHRQEVRKLLTKEQKLYYDNRRMHRRRGSGMYGDHRRNKGKGMSGYCPYRK